MVNLTFGEQVKIILGRKGMTIKELAELMGERTGKPMSRQNMTQRLGRDNFQEQDMRLIAEILGCKFQLSIMDEADIIPEIESKPEAESAPEVESKPETESTPEVESEPETESTPEVEMKAEVENAPEPISVEPVSEKSRVYERDITIGELVDIPDEKAILKKGIKGFLKKSTSINGEKNEGPILGEINPYTGKEYKSNSVRMHPKRIGYVQVYDQEQHKWTDMTEWAFLGYQERKKHLLGKNYEPPIYLD